MKFDEALDKVCLEKHNHYWIMNFRRSTKEIIEIMNEAAELYARSKCNQVWLPIEGYDGYEISNFGHVRNDKQYITVSRNSNGYFRVSLCKNSDQRKFFIHQLVAEYFIGPKPEGMIVMHIDSNRMNNHFSNLKYGTQSENLKQAINEGRKPSLPNKCKTPKLVEESIISYRKSGMKLREICDISGLPLRTIQNILTRNGVYKPEFK